MWSCKSCPPVWGAGGRRLTLYEEVPLHLQANDVALRQLRHNTRNTMQRIVGLLSEAPELVDHARGRRLAQDLIDRICLSVDIADALFCVLSVHGGMEARLRLLSRALVRVFSAPGQDVEVRIDVDTELQESHAETILQIAHELVSNAVKHGLHGYPAGEIMIMLQKGPHDGIRLIVSDNGPGFAAEPELGEGLRMVRDIVARNGGKLTLPEPGRQARVQVYMPPGWRRYGI